MLIPRVVSRFALHRCSSLILDICTGLHVRGEMLVVTNLAASRHRHRVAHAVAMVGQIAGPSLRPGCSQGAVAFGFGGVSYRIALIPLPFHYTADVMHPPAPQIRRAAAPSQALQE